MKGTAVLLLFTATFCRGAVVSHEECLINSQLTPHENCNQYYQCVNGALIVRNCSSILYFNPITQECDWPANVDCGDEDDTTNEASRCSSGKAEGEFFAHENCNQYYRCIHGRLIEYTCHPDLVFNYKTLQCDWPYNVDCKSVTPFPDTENPDETETENPDIDITPSPDNCVDSCENSREDDKSDENSSVHDSNGSSSNESDSDSDRSNESVSNEDDSTEGQSSVEDSSNDDSNEDVSTDVNKVCGAESSEGMLFPHDDCSKFYICSGGKPVVMNCPTGLLFNPETEQCDWPKKVECANNKKSVKKLEINVDVTVRGKKGLKG